MGRRSELRRMKRELKKKGVQEPYLSAELDPEGWKPVRIYAPHEFRGHYRDQWEAARERREYRRQWGINPDGGVSYGGVENSEEDED